MAKYTGRRIVPKHAGEWDIRKEYEELQIVLDADSGNSFISNLPVPKGTALSDEKYWSLFSLHSEQIAEAEEHLTQTAEDIRSELSETENRINKNVSDTEGRMQWASDPAGCGELSYTGLCICGFGWQTEWQGTAHGIWPRPVRRLQLASEQLRTLRMGLSAVCAGQVYTGTTGYEMMPGISRRKEKL